jgi:hypothetical protein
MKKTRSRKSRGTVPLRVRGCWSGCTVYLFMSTPEQTKKSRRDGYVDNRMYTEYNDSLLMGKEQERTRMK